MGASDWHYSVPYQEDIAQALEQLRADVYASGDYYKKEPDPTLQLSEEEFAATLDLDNDPDGIQEFLLGEWRKAKQRPVPMDADTLIAAQPDSGTHSIIDVCQGLSETPQLFTASPLSVDQLLECFGTERPVTAQVMEWMSGYDIGRLRSRWEAAYLVSYAATGEPDRIHFRGYSGD